MNEALAQWTLLQHRIDSCQRALKTASETAPYTGIDEIAAQLRTLERQAELLAPSVMHAMAYPPK